MSMSALRIPADSRTVHGIRLRNIRYGQQLPFASNVHTLLYVHHSLQPSLSISIRRASPQFLYLCSLLGQHLVTRSLAAV